MKQKIQIIRFYKMDKALQLVEGTNVAALWAHLIDAYNYFEENDMVRIEYTIFQASKIIQSFTGIGVKAQATARKRLEELGFLKFKVAAVPGNATKSTFYILYPDKYKDWTSEHDYDKLRDEKYHELQDSAEHDKLDQWIKDNMKDSHKQIHKRINQMQNAEGTFANHTNGHLQTRPLDICNTPKDTVIETVLIETKELENTQKNKDDCVYDGKPYIYLKNKSKDQLIDLIIETYQKMIIMHHPAGLNSNSFDKERYIGNLDNIEKTFSEMEIEVVANCYIGVLGYLYNMVDETFENPGKFRATHKLENLLKFNTKTIFSRENRTKGERKYESTHKPVSKLKSL